MNESITFAGWNTLDDLGLVLVQSPELSPPEPKYDLVEIPGGDGSIDLSEATGDIRYSDRVMKFGFLMTGRTPEGLEVEKTDVSRKLHGVRADFTLSWDEGFTYTGRASITDYPNLYTGGTFELEITANPYKYGGRQTWYVNAAGGVAVIIPCGRRKWSPTFQVQRDTLVTHNGTGWMIPPGTSKVTDLYLDPGDNVLILNTDPDYGTTTWNDLSGETWATLSAQYRRWYQVAAGSSPRQVPLYWSDLSGETWEDFPSTRWVELVHDADFDPSYGVYIQTEIYEL